MNWYLKVLQQYVDFNGRARRKEYWMFVLFNFIIALVLTTIDMTLLDGTPVFYGIYGVAVFLPTLAVLIRRLHDTGRSGWWMFITLIPLIGGFILLYFMCVDSEAGSNQWGPNPKSGMSDKEKEAYG